MTYQLVLFDENSEYVYDQKELKKALKAYNKYKTGVKEADEELLDDLLKNVKKYKIKKTDKEDIVEIIEYQYQLR